MSSKKFNRRQFAKSVAVGAAVATTTAVTAKACPLLFDESGNRIEFFCIVAFDDLDPFIWVYTWESCLTGKRFKTLDAPGLPIGSCSNATNDPGCLLNHEIGRFVEIQIGGKEYKHRPDLPSKTLRMARSILS